MLEAIIRSIYQEFAHLRCCYRLGLLGILQISGRQGVDFEDWADLECRSMAKGIGAIKKKSSIKALIVLSLFRCLAIRGVEFPFAKGMAKVHLTGLLPATRPWSYRRYMLVMIRRCRSLRRKMCMYYVYYLSEFGIVTRNSKLETTDRMRLIIRVKSSIASRGNSS